MVPLRASTTKSESLPDDPTAFVPSRPWNLPSITTWDDSRNQNHPTDSAEEALFHPLYQSHYQFRQLPDEGVQDHRLLHISFEQVSRDHPLSVLQVRELEYPLQWRGTAWIDPASWAVVRIQAGLGDSMADMGLLRLDADVTYSNVQFNSTTSYWLPARAVIDAETKRQHWHNTHLFTGYKRFTVDTDVKISAPQ